MTDLPTALVAARQRSGLSQTQLAERLGVRSSTVSRREAGALQVLAPDLVRLAQALGVRFAVGQDGWELLEPEPPFTPNPDRDGDVGGRLGVPGLGLGAAGSGVLNERPDGRTLDLDREWLRHVDGLADVRGDSMQPVLYDGD